MILRYEKGTEMYLADILSRHYLETSKETQAAVEVSQVRSRFEEDLETEVQMAEINQLVADEATVAKYRTKTALDETLPTVLTFIKKGWPEDKKQLPPTVIPY